MTCQYCIDEFLRRFPEHFNAYTENIDDYFNKDGEILAHTFFGDFVNIPLFELLEKNENKELIEKYIDFLNFMQQGNKKIILEQSDTHTIINQDDVQNVLSVTIMARLGDSEKVLKNAFTYFSEELMLVSQHIENYWGRRKIIISYRRGKIYGRW